MNKLTYILREFCGMNSSYASFIPPTPRTRHIKPRIRFVSLTDGYPQKWWRCSDEWWYRAQGIISNQELRGSGSTPSLAYADYCRKRDGSRQTRIHPFSDATVGWGNR